jgi:hypothetical protein
MYAWEGDEVYATARCPENYTDMTTDITGVDCARAQGSLKRMNRLPQPTGVSH